MADNVTLNSMAGGEAVGADDIAGVKYQRIKMIHGADGVNDGDVSSVNPLPINFTKSATVIDLTTTPLGIAGSYTSATFDHSLNGAYVTHYIFADQDGTHYFEESHDGTTWKTCDTEPVSADVLLRESHQAIAKYSRSRYVNGGTAQGVFLNQSVQKHIGQDEYVKISDSQNAITGNKTNNGQGPSINNLGVLPVVATTAAPSYTEGNQAAISTTLTGDTRVTMDGESVAITAASLPLPAGAATSAKQDTLLTELQLKADLTETQPVSLASVPSHAVTNAGTFATQAAATLAAETTKVIGTVNVSAGQTITDVPAASGGLSKFHLVSAASTNATNLKASAGQVYAITAFNLNAAAMYLKFHNTAGTPTAGTGVTDTFLIPGNTAGAGVVINIDKGIIFTTGIGITLVTGITDASAVAVGASEIVLNIYFK